MTPNEQGPKNSYKEEVLDQARAEIEQFVEQERSGVLVSKHLAREGQHFNITELVPEDLRMWHFIRHAPDALTWDQYAEYRQKETERAKKLSDPSRMDFIACLNNLAASIFAKRQLEELRKQKSQ